MKALHSNILKLMDNIINKIAANIHAFSTSDKAFYPLSQAQCR
jgi:hypothetical protein